jgi:glycosyltransferase involved in cell wall biosynthesis
MERAIRGNRTLKISIAATNPCHLWPLARELATARVLGAYYSGYPLWKLGGANGSEVRTHSLRTNIVYGLLKYVPATLRPDAKNLFRWQDHGFDRWVGAYLESCDFIHAMPGQALATFRRARQLRVKTVLNHATGPVRDWVRIMEPEYERVGLKLEDHCPYDDAYFAREDEEYALADFHCAASTVVRDQLVARGIASERVWVVPYGADPAIFFPAKETPTGFRILFAGQVCLRKGVRALLASVAMRSDEGWRVDFYGADTGECARDLAEYRGSVPLHFHGAVSQAQLADAMRKASVLVLPSLEEGFGLVVPQALNCGVPCLTSERVGAKDLIRHRENGSIVTAQDPNALAEELAWWAAQPRRVIETFGWTDPAHQLIALSISAL